MIAPCTTRLRVKQEFPLEGIKVAKLLFNGLSQTEELVKPLSGLGK